MGRRELLGDRTRMKPTENNLWKKFRSAASFPLSLAKATFGTCAGCLRLSQEFVFVNHRSHGDFAVAIVHAHDLAFATHADAFGQGDFGRKG